MDEIPLADGGCFSVNPEHYEFFMQWDWHLSKSGYAVREEVVEGVPIEYSAHRTLMAAMGQTRKGLVVHHMDSNRLNNRLANLQMVTYHQNTLEGKRPKWVRKAKDGCNWEAHIRVRGKRLRLGVFPSRQQAEYIYDSVAVYCGVYDQHRDGLVVVPNFFGPQKPPALVALSVQRSLNSEQARSRCTRRTTWPDSRLDTELSAEAWERIRMLGGYRAR
jgi:hypothetical protein